MSDEKMTANISNVTCPDGKDFGEQICESFNKRYRMILVERLKALEQTLINTKAELESLDKEESKPLKPGQSKGVTDRLINKINAIVEASNENFTDLKQRIEKLEQQQRSTEESIWALAMKPKEDEQPPELSNKVKTAIEKHLGIKPGFLLMSDVSSNQPSHGLSST